MPIRSAFTLSQLTTRANVTPPRSGAVGYLRVSKYTVLETRIHLENPTLLNSWFLHSRDPVLPKVIEAVRSLVLPKLREESERVMRGGAKGKKGRAVKDVVFGDGFEVTVFLTEGGTQHAVLSKTRLFQGSLPRIKSNSSKLLGSLESTDVTILEEPGASSPNLLNIPTFTEGREEEMGNDLNDEQEVINVESSDEEDNIKDEKKPFSRTSYDGFSIYSRVLCLIVKKRDSSAATEALPNASASVPLPELDTYVVQQSEAGGRSLMEDWITMTQIVRQDQDAGEI